MERGPSKEGASGRPMDERGYLASHPPELRIEGALDEIRRRVVESGRRVVVLDDDPTGVQSVHGVPVLTTWAVGDLRWALGQTSPTFYILTNSRSLAEEEAIALNQEIARNLSEAAALGTDFDVVSRSDSTLRGHYPAETDALAEALREGGRGPDGLIVCPAFFEAGRITVDDVPEAALALDGVRGVKMSVPRLLEPESREIELGRVAEEVNGSLASSEVVLYTSRELVTAGEAGSAGLSNFQIGAAVSGALVEVMRRVDRELPLSFVVAKGGITSSDIATKGLEVRRAEVAGPLLPPGIVPVWILPEENDFPGLPYVIFPGNVGGPGSLAQAIEILRAER
jgi:uncharacterized protein YgbK (DUF1537 family)